MALTTIWIKTGFWITSRNRAVQNDDGLCARARVRHDRLVILAYARIHVEVEQWILDHFAQRRGPE
jgi:hypothetical protein